MACGDHGGSPLHLAPILLLLLCLHLPGTVSRGDQGMDGEQLEPLPSGVDAGMEPKGFLTPQIRRGQVGPSWSYGRPPGNEYERPDGGQFGSYGGPFGPYGGDSSSGRPGRLHGGSTYGSSGGSGSGSYGSGGFKPMVYGSSCSETVREDGSEPSGSSCPGSGGGGFGGGASSYGSSGGGRPKLPGKSCPESPASGGSGSSGRPCSRPSRGARIELIGQGGPNMYPGSSSGPSRGYISGSYDGGRSESYLGGSSRSAWGGRRNQPGSFGAAGSGSYGNAEWGDSAGSFSGYRDSSSSGHIRLQAKPSGIPYILGISGLGRRTAFIPVHKDPENSGMVSPSAPDGSVLLRPHDKDPDVPSVAPLSERLNLGNTDYHSPGNAADAADKEGAGMGSGDVATSGSDFSDPTVHGDA
ncbi:keratin, type I cytoskeletal 9-like [Alligator sinensis]|uniref:Keratin, type I cytoskeletal 9-like n=1 Tax=Alligator sinensis TaxID=38654 RepID=A0A1U7SC25_ALLSI|nr:keratin, type I cytoskeletal 9-like [Alligator sinensis]